MLCMKCGKKTADTQVFCDNCLAQMRKFPVRPDIPVQIPVRPEPDKKALSKKEARPEIIIARLRRRLKRLRLALVCAVLALALAVGLLFYTNKQPAPGDTGSSPYTAATDSHLP